MRSERGMLCHLINAGTPRQRAPIIVHHFNIMAIMVHKGRQRGNDHPSPLMLKGKKGGLDVRL